jgi:hypothetical protein
MRLDEATFLYPIAQSGHALHSLAPLTPQAGIMLKQRYQGRRKIDPGGHDQRQMGEHRNE